MINKIINNITCTISSIIVIYEVTIGILQYLGQLPSRHILFRITGTFNNPGPYGGVLAICLTIIIASIIIGRQHPFTAALSYLSVLLCVIMLPSTRSRAALLSLLVGLFFLFKKETDYITRLKSSKVLCIISASIIISTSVLLFYAKKDSALGRFHIWRIEALALKEEPLKGTGPHTVLGTYGLTQAAFFKEKNRSPHTIRIAGCPQYAFNEYLRIGIEHGIPAMVIFILFIASLIKVSIKHRLSIGYGLIAFSVFSFFSYPIEACSEKQSPIELVKGRNYIQNGLYPEAIQMLEPLYPGNERNYKFLYDLGYALHKECRYEESNFYLTQGAKYSSDPMFHNIMGKNYEALSNIPQAENEYILAHYMIPSRIYPLYLLMQMKCKLGDNDEAISIGEQILTMPYNSSHKVMIELRRECAHLLDSLERDK